MEPITILLTYAPGDLEAKWALSALLQELRDFPSTDNFELRVISSTDIDEKMQKNRLKSMDAESQNIKNPISKDVKDPKSIKGKIQEPVVMREVPAIESDHILSEEDSFAQIIYDLTCERPLDKGQNSTVLSSKPISASRHSPSVPPINISNLSHQYENIGTMFPGPNFPSDKNVRLLLLSEFPKNMSQLAALINYSRDDHGWTPLLDGIIEIVSPQNASAAIALLNSSNHINTISSPFFASQGGAQQNRIENNSLFDESVPVSINNIRKLILNELILKSENSFWSDLTLDQVSCNNLDESMELKTGVLPVLLTPFEIKKKVIDRLIDVHNRKEKFKAWSRNHTKKIKIEFDHDVLACVAAAQIVACDDNNAVAGNHQNNVWTSKPLYRRYSEYMTLIPPEIHTSASVLFAVTLSVSEQAFGFSEFHDESCQGSNILFPEPWQSSLNNINSSELNNGLCVVVEAGDNFSRSIVNYRHLKFSDQKSRSLVLDDLVLFEKNAIRRCQYPRLFGPNAFPIFPQHSLVERSTLETELLTFTPLSAGDVFRYNRLQNFENLVSETIPKVPNFTGNRLSDDTNLSITQRKFYRNIHGFLLPQILSQEILTEPCIKRKYYPLTDELLLALVWVPPHRRIGEKLWSPAHNMRLRPTLSTYLTLLDENMTPRISRNLSTYMDMSAEEIVRFSLHTTVLCPADNAIILVKDHQFTKDAWLTVHLMDSIIGLRKILNSCDKKITRKSEGTFFCQSLNDDTRITISLDNLTEQKRLLKPDKKETVSCNVSYIDGCSVLSSSSGSIKITLSHSVRNLPQPNPLGVEISRYILHEGRVSRHLVHEEIHYRDILYPDGSRMIIRNLTKMTKKSTTNQKYRHAHDIFLHKVLSEGPSDWNCVFFSRDGSLSYYKNHDDFSNTDTKIFLTSETSNMRQYFVDAETGHEIEKYDDGRVVITWIQDGLREVYFSDGTKITSVDNMVFIFKKGLPSIEIDVQLDTVSKSHALGQKVPIAQGGERVRAKIALLDGTAIFIRYNTTVTALYNGSLKIVKRNKEVILAEDGGVVTFCPSYAWTNQTANDFMKDVSDKIISKATENRFLDNNDHRGKYGKDTWTNSAIKTVLSMTKEDPQNLTNEKNTKLGDINAQASTLSNHPKADTRYVFHLSNLSCHVEDHENNTFDVSLLNAHEPKLQLAGEVLGLKPTAVSASTIEPRLFVVNRSGSATEVVRISESLELQSKLQRCTSGNDTLLEQFISVGCNPSSDLMGNATCLNYFQNIRNFKTDPFLFEEVIGPREWHHRPLPALASAILIDNYHHHPEMSSSESFMSPTREIRQFLEFAPLSSEGYKQLTDDISKWRTWQLKQNLSIQQFATEDPRSTSDKDNEKEITAKLKKAYKLAKLQQQKYKEKTTKEIHPVLEVVESLHDSLEDIPEFSDEDNSSDESVDDPEVLELRDAFDTFALGSPLIDPNVDIINGRDNRYVLFSDVKHAMLQIFNHLVTQKDVDVAVENTYLNDRSSDLTEAAEVSFDEFARIYYSLKSHYQSINSNSGSLSNNNILIEHDSEVNFQTNNNFNAAQACSWSLFTSTSAGSGVRAVRKKKGLSQ